MNHQNATRPATAVIVTYQSLRTVHDALAAARRCFDAQLLDCIVVDNGSSDGTAELLQRDAQWAHTILTGRNNGFGRGCNIGFTRVATPYTIFINPDAQVEPDALRAMLNFMEANPRAGIVGPAIIAGGDEGPRELQGTGLRPTPASLIRAAIPLLPCPNVRQPIIPGSAPARTGWICGAVFMIRTELMSRLGGFDPRFFLYWEETDVCARVEALGFEIWTVGTAVARHIGGASSDDRDTLIDGCIAKHYYQSRRYYLIKHHGWMAATFTEVVEYFLLTLGGVADVIRGRGLSRMRPRLGVPLLSQPERVSPISK